MARLARGQVEPEHPAQRLLARPEALVEPADLQALPAWLVDRLSKARPAAARVVAWLPHLQALLAATADATILPAQPTPAVQPTPTEPRPRLTPPGTSLAKVPAAVVRPSAAQPATAVRELVVRAAAAEVQALLSLQLQEAVEPAATDSW